MPDQTTPVELPLTLTFKNGPTVHRLGLGAMRIAGVGVWGFPRDEGEAIALLRRAVDKGVSFIDTADSYCPRVALLFDLAFVSITNTPPGPTTTWSTFHSTLFLFAGTS